MSHILGLSKETNQHFSKQGIAKKELTLQEAIAEGKRVKKKHYQCGLCGNWHVGGYKP